MRYLNSDTRGTGGCGAEGFTILEIMIATAILTIGLVSVLALFPVAIHTGKKVVDTSTAAVIAESVAEAIREGMRNQSRTRDKQGIPHHYFIFKHDGVRDPIPNDKAAELPGKDYFILLPRYLDGKGGTFSGASEEIRSTNALSIAKTFVYPETDPSPNGGGSAFLADDDGDDWEDPPLPDGKRLKDIRVERTYPLGVFLPGDEASGIAVLEDQQVETLKQYSYAFAIRASKFDGNQSLSPQQYQPANRLYNVRVMVFRGFIPPAPDRRHEAPVFELDFEVAL